MTHTLPDWNNRLKRQRDYIEAWFRTSYLILGIPDGEARYEAYKELYELGEKQAAQLALYPDGYEKYRSNYD